MCATSGKEVLIVDDNRDVRNAIASYLSFSGFAVSTARHGGEALVTLKEKSFSVLISDLEMPQMNGIDLIRAVRDLGVPLIIIGMSGEHREDEFFKAGADYFLPKPLDYRNLKSILLSISGK